MKYQLLRGDPQQFKNLKTGLPIKLYRIIALKDFESKGGLVREGEIGGFIQSEKNLSQNDSSWVAQMARVMDNVELKDSYVTNDAILFQNAKIENSFLSGKVRVWGDAKIVDSILTENVDVYDQSVIIGSKMKNGAVACGKSQLVNSEMRDGSRISQNAKVTDSKLFEQSEVKGTGIVENCHLSGRTVWSVGNLRNESRNETIELNVFTNAN